MERLLPMKEPYDLDKKTARIKKEWDGIDPTDKDARERIALLDAECAETFRDVLVKNKDTYVQKYGIRLKRALKDLNDACMPVHDTAIENSESLMRHIAAKKDEQAPQLDKMGYT